MPQSLRAASRKRRKLSKDKHFVAEEFRKFLTDNGAEEVKLLDYDKLYIYKGWLHYQKTAALND